MDLTNSDVRETSECVTDLALRETSLRLYPPGTVLVAMYGGFQQIGRTGLLRTPATVNQAITAIQPAVGVLVPEYLLATLNYRVDHWRSVASSSRKDPNITSYDIRTFQIALPSSSEQRAIAAALSGVDALLAGLTRLIAKKRELKQAAMQQLLTGRTRLPGFEESWATRKIGEIATPSSVRNLAGDDLPVLSCSKHDGFVDSLAYFKNQVFSDDLTGYRVIRRGEIGYPANHIEEGSIGLQDLYDAALVSPIYVVFSVSPTINSYFLHRQLKLDRYRHIFRKATASSVDRRGSLRWPAFSEIMVRVPSFPEQSAIATVLSDMDAELAALEARRAKTQALKQAMMQALLTGRVRLVSPEPAHA